MNLTKELPLESSLHLPSRQISRRHPNNSPVCHKEELVQGSKTLFQRQWPGVTVLLREAPSRVPPTLLSFEQYPMLVLQLSGVRHVMWDKGGLERHGSYLGTGSLVLLAPNQPELEMEWTAHSVDPIRVLIIYVDYSLLAAAAAAEADLDIARFEMVHSTDLGDPLLKQLICMFAHEVQQPEAHSELYAETAAQMLAMQLLRRHGHIRAPGAKARRVLLSNKSLRLVGEYVHAHLHAAVTLRELAAIAGLSPAHFCTTFRRTTGQSPNQYVIAQRMARAADLLARTDLTVAHIASLVGYESVSQFSVLFKRQMGVSPGVYARRPLE